MENDRSLFYDLLDEDHSYKGCIWFKLSSGIIVLLATVVFFFLVLYTHKFIKIYGSSNKCLLMFFVMLNLAIVLRIAFIIEEIINRKQ